MTYAVLGTYLGLGLVFAVAFIVRGAGSIDEVARASPWHVRMLWMPGAAALWPLLLVTWLRAKRGAA